MFGVEHRINFTKVLVAAILAFNVSNVLGQSKNSGSLVSTPGLM